MTNRRIEIAIGCVLALGIGCGDDGVSSDGGSLGVPIDEDLPAYACGDTDTDTGGEGDTEECETDGTSGATAGDTTETGDEGADECVSSEECGGGVCVAPFDEARGPYACEFVCVANLDDAIWCADDGACCDPGARCTNRGYCVVE
jgi:hypothetical protein